MKKLVFLLVAFVGVAFAFPPDFCNGCKPILSDKGVMSKNTFKNKACKSGDFGVGCFSGEVELTGAIVSAYNYEYEVNVFEARFYPDTNLDLPFLYKNFCNDTHKEQGAVFDEVTRSWDCSNVSLNLSDYTLA